MPSIRITLKKKEEGQIKLAVFNQSILERLYWTFISFPLVGFIFSTI
jgi:hypothetical protein